jgi:hypothetical protein
VLLQEETLTKPPILLTVTKLTLFILDCFISSKLFSLETCQIAPVLTTWIHPEIRNSPSQPPGTVTTHVNCSIFKAIIITVSEWRHYTGGIIGRGVAAHLTGIIASRTVAYIVTILAIVLIQTSRSLEINKCIDWASVDITDEFSDFAREIGENLGLAMGWLQQGPEAQLLNLKL